MKNFFFQIQFIIDSLLISNLCQYLQYQQIMETVILRERNLTLSSLNTTEGVKIIAKVVKNASEKIYEGLLPTAEKQEIISTYFESPREIISHMRVRENIDIEIDNELMMTIKVMSRLNTKKTKFMEIFRISLILVKMDMKKMISSVIKDCNAEGEISKEIVKKSIKTIAVTLERLLLEKESNKPGINYSVPSFSPNILQKFQLFKEEVHDLIYQYKKENSTKYNFDQRITCLKNLQEKTTKLEQRFDQQYFMISEQIRLFGERFSQQLDLKMKKILSKYATSKDIQIVNKKIKYLGYEFQLLENLVKYKSQNQIEISPNSISETNITDLLKSDYHFRNQSLFKKNQNRVEYIGEDNQASHYIFKNEIPQDKQYRFKIKMLKLASPQIYIGIFDYSQQTQKYFNMKKTWCYGASGQGFHPNKYQKQFSVGFQQGDTVQVIVNIPQEKIQWCVNGVNRITYSCVGRQRSLMPFIQVWKTSTEVQWMSDD